MAKPTKKQKALAIKLGDNQKLYTVYRRDPAGFVHEVWLLTADEYRKIGGTDAGNPEGYKRFIELLNLIWAARTAGLFR